MRIIKEMKDRMSKSNIYLIGITKKILENMKQR